MRMIFLLKWERLGLLITGNEGVSPEEDSEGRRRIQGPRGTDRAIK